MSRANKKDGYQSAASHLVIKRVQEEAREIEGWATTISPDHIGDCINPRGAKYSLPLPLLFSHAHDKPIGRVIAATVEKTGIKFRAVISKITEPGTLKDRVDEAWQSIKADLISSVSVGFKPVKATPLKGGGMMFDEWTWLELSICTVPCNPEALITSRRSLALTLSGLEAKAVTRVVRLAEPDRGRVVRLDRPIERGNGQR